MRFDGRLVAIVAVSCVCVVLPRRVAADEWNKRTVVTFSEAAAVPGKAPPTARASRSTNR
jgi:hypothetical protein